MMAGWLSAQSLEKAFKRGEIKESVKKYLIRRIFKLLPFYYIAVLSFLLLTGSMADNCTGKRLAGTLFLFQNFLIYDWGGVGGDPPCYDIAWYVSLQF
jgi:peptidoglycan/LPS O-acetylase OafA/YrhL